MRVSGDESTRSGSERGVAGESVGWSYSAVFAAASVSSSNQYLSCLACPSGWSNLRESE